jgi:starvation-inducible DNA-binding protein
MGINIGLTETQRQSVIALLNNALADTYLLVVKTKKYHWDVVGPQFRSLHTLWEEHYEALTVNIDAYAERVRMLGGYPLGTVEGFLKHSSIREHPGDLPNTQQMVMRLVLDHEQIIRNLRKYVKQVSEDCHDEGTADFLTGLMAQHEEMAWMLRSFVEGEALETLTERSRELTAPAGV